MKIGDEGVDITSMRPGPSMQEFDEEPKSAFRSIRYEDVAKV